MPEPPQLTGNAQDDCRRLLGHIMLLQQAMADWWQLLNLPGSVRLQANAIDSCPIGTDGRDAGKFTTVDATGNITATSSIIQAFELYGQSLSLVDAVTAPSTVAGKAQLYADITDGDLKVKFGDGVVKTIVVDT